MKIKYKTGDLPISKYQRTLEIFKDNSKSDLDKNIEILAIYCDEEVGNIMKMTPEKVGFYISEMTEMIKNYKTNYSKRLKSLKINDVLYNINYDVTKLNVSQYVDYQMILQRNDYIGNLDNLLSVFIIPKGKNYNEGYDVDEVRQLIADNITLDVALSILFFLAKKSTNLIKRKIMYCKALMKVMRWTSKKKVEKENLKIVLEQMKELEKYLTDI